MPELIPVLNKNDIEKMVARIARKISSDYQDQELILIGILNGAFVFLSDLVRHLTIPVKIDFIRVCSYGSGDSSSGNIRLTKEIEIDGNSISFAEYKKYTKENIIEHISTLRELKER